jgi:hypothetical protein
MFFDPHVPASSEQNRTNVAPSTNKKLFIGNLGLLAECAQPIENNRQNNVKETNFFVYMITGPLL